MTEKKIFVDFGREKGTHYEKPVDIGDPTRAHPLDAPHIKEYFEQKKIDEDNGISYDEGKKNSEDDPLPLSNKRPELTQFTANCVRVRILRQLVKNHLAEYEKRKKLGDTTVCHVWFNEPYADNYSLRSGNAPPDSDRPKWMRGLKLHIDVLNPGDIVTFAATITRVSGG